MKSNLWPDFIDKPLITPKTILKQQAAFFTDNMKGILHADVLAMANQTPKQLTFSFVIKAPFLGNYIFSLFEITHGLMLYPVDVVYSEKVYKVASEAELEAKLSEIFNTAETIQTIRALYSQSI